MGECPVVKGTTSGFADEVFRVFQQHYLAIIIELRHMDTAVKMMVNHVLRKPTLPLDSHGPFYIILGLPGCLQRFSQI